MANGNGQTAAMMARREGQWRAIADQVLGRTQGPVQFDTAAPTFAAVTTVRPNRALDATVPIKAIAIRLAGRLVIGTADYTTDGLEIPQNLVQRIRLRGRHVTYGAQTLIDMSGATAYMWPRLFQSQGAFKYSGAAVNSLDPAETIPLAAGAAMDISTIEFDIWYYLPMYPMLGPGPYEPRWTAPYYLRAEDWGSSLQLEIDLADNTGLGDPAATTTTTFTAYGSAAGTPALEIYTIHSLLGPFAKIPGRGFVLRSEDPAPTFRVAAGTNLSLVQLRKQITTNILVKTFDVIPTGISAGVVTADVASDRHLNRTKVVLNNKYLRDTEDNRSVKVIGSMDWNTIHPEGYLLFSFVDSKNPLTALRTDLSEGMFEIRTDVLAAVTADSQQHITQEIIVGGPFPA